MRVPQSALPLLLLLVSCLSNTELVMGDDVYGLDNAQTVAGDYVPLTCWNFTIGDRRHREFYSPQYPDNYSNSTECMQLLVAPQGYRIRLDFRDEFHIEYSDGCKYDFLELRDGPFGYSQLLGRYCGKQHPPMTESTARFLWIRFKSDDSIEYKGFRAVFEYFKPEADDFLEIESKSNSSRSLTPMDDEVCRKEVPISTGEGYLKSSELPSVFLEKNNRTGIPIDCTFVIYAPPKHRVFLKWVQDEYKMTTPQNCADSYLEIFERTTALSDRNKKICGSLARDFKSTSNHVYLRVFAQSTNLVPRFKALYTIYTPGPCTEDLFDCGDDTCIDPSLVCDGTVNCNYSWDEMNCEEDTGAIKPKTTKKPLMVRYHTIILSVVGGVILFIIVISVCITCQQRKREERRRQHALKQDERRAVEVEMTNLLNRSQHGTPVHHRQTPHGNHVGRAAAAGTGLTVANHVNHVPVNGHGNKPNGHKPNHHHSHNHHNHHHNAYGGEYEVDTSADGPSFRRFLDVDPYPEDISSNSHASTHDQVPTLVTIEKPPRGRKGEDIRISNKGYDPRDKSPSPRPDVVQEEKFVYSTASDTLNPDNNNSNLRRLSVDTVKSDKSDIWKPMTTVQTDIPQANFQCAPIAGSASAGTSPSTNYPQMTASDQGAVLNARTLPRVNFNFDNLEKKPPPIVQSTTLGRPNTSTLSSNIGGGYHPNPDSNNIKFNTQTYPHGINQHPQTYIEDPYINRNPSPSNFPPPPQGLQPYIQTPPQSKRLQKVPPKPPQRSPQTELQSGTFDKKSSETPDIFYTRPRRQIPNPQARHAEV